MNIRRRRGGRVAVLVAGLLLLTGFGSSAAAAESSVTYVVVGDSYSSGEGNRPFEQGAPKCHRSLSNAWPSSVRNGDGGKRIDLTANLACSGALTDALTTSFKGQSPQLVALARQKPSPGLVTITIGGNDVGFGGVLTACLFRDCVRDGTLTNTRDQVTSALPEKLRSAYAATKATIPSARLLVVGYPQIFPGRQEDAIRCGWLEPTERESLNQLAVALDSAVEDAARATGTEFVSTLPVMAGHELCTRDSWINPMRIQRDVQGGGHPAPLGQAAIAGAVTRYLADRPAS